MSRLPRLFALCAQFLKCIPVLYVLFCCSTLSRNVKRYRCICFDSSFFKTDISPRAIFGLLTGSKQRPTYFYCWRPFYFKYMLISRVRAELINVNIFL